MELKCEEEIKAKLALESQLQDLKDVVKSKANELKDLENAAEKEIQLMIEESRENLGWNEVCLKYKI